MTQGVLKTHGICLMMYFKNNLNAGPFFLLHGYFRRKKTYIYIYIDFQTRMNIYIYDLSYILLFIYSNIQPINITGNFAFILIESETNRK